MNPYKIQIDNIPAPVWAHMVNGFHGTSDAYAVLSPDEQRDLVCSKLVEFAFSIAKGHAVNMAQLAAGRATAAQADALFAQTRQSLEYSAGEAVPESEISDSVAHDSTESEVLPHEI